MRSQRVNPALFTKNGGELSLSGPALTRLLRPVLDQGASFRFRARGFSMSPFVKNGDVLTVFPLSGRPRLGDVVAFAHPGTGKLVIHRVVAKRDGIYLTRGDSAERDDGPIMEADILGYITKVERNGKEVSLGLGPERYLIAFLTRKRLLLTLLLPVLRLLRAVLRRMPT